MLAQLRLMTKTQWGHDVLKWQQVMIFSFNNAASTLVPPAGQTQYVMPIKVIKNRILFFSLRSLSPAPSLSGCKDVSVKDLPPQEDAELKFSQWRPTCSMYSSLSKCSWAEREATVPKLCYWSTCYSPPPVSALLTLFRNATLPQNLLISSSSLLIYLVPVGWCHLDLWHPTTRARKC